MMIEDKKWIKRDRKNPEKNLLSKYANLVNATIGRKSIGRMTIGRMTIGRMTMGQNYD
jgi:hypothetical protein